MKRRIITLIILLNLCLNITAQADFTLPDQRFELIEAGSIGKIVKVQFREREVVNNEDTIEIELLSWVRNHRYVTLIFDKSRLPENYFDTLFKNQERATITCKITAESIIHNQVPAGNITTYLLTAEIPKPTASHYGPKIYELEGLEYNADLKALTNQLLENEESLITEPGDFTVMFFTTTYWGQKHTVLHDSLILKLNAADEVIDAYHFTIESIGEESMQIRSMTAENVTLQSGIDINTLKLKGSDGIFYDDGVIYY